MSAVDRIRSVIALLLVVTGPGSVLFWFPIHPLAAFWRRVGAHWGYAAGILVYIGSAAVAASYHRVLLAVDFGTSAITAAAGIFLFAAQLWVLRRWRRRLMVKTLLGVPELVPERHAGALVTEGVYARVRHPRYVQIIVGCAAYALISNYLAAYATVAVIAIVILVLIPIEERELAARFGAEYEAYRQRVPALIPRVLRLRGQSGEARPRS
jgi:protein-S-isoprenylcysteine O-methyltransferase Ste14